MDLIDARGHVRIKLMVRVPGLSIKVEWKPNLKLDTCPTIDALNWRLRQLGY